MMWENSLKSSESALSIKARIHSLADGCEELTSEISGLKRQLEEAKKEIEVSSSLNSKIIVELERQLNQLRGELQEAKKQNETDSAELTKAWDKVRELEVMTRSAIPEKWRKALSDKRIHYVAPDIGYAARLLVDAFVDKSNNPTFSVLCAVAHILNWRDAELEKGAE